MCLVVPITGSVIVLTLLLTLKILSKAIGLILGLAVWLDSLLVVAITLLVREMWQLKSEAGEAINVHNGDQHGKL
jgi:hypothetical protein